MQADSLPTELIVLFCVLNSAGNGPKETKYSWHGLGAMSQEPEPRDAWLVPDLWHAQPFMLSSLHHPYSQVRRTLHWNLHLGGR